ncbi:PepSY domain-containing protein [Leptotrichia alba]|uniref:PepSY domain-containing protein n=1 Tax=Leptotrichia alba TaxID=3239304 RepID=A0AB39V6F7_9FUSO
MKNKKIKKGCFNYIITLITFLLSISFSTKAKGNSINFDKSILVAVSIKSSDGQITANRAKAIALSHAGISESSANFKKIKLDNKNGKPVYEIEFVANNSRYEFEINASIGSIIKFNKR